MKSLRPFPGEFAPWFKARALSGTPTYTFDTVAGRHVAGIKIEQRHPQPSITNAPCDGGQILARRPPELDCAEAEPGRLIEAFQEWVLLEQDRYIEIEMKHCVTFLGLSKVSLSSDLLYRWEVWRACALQEIYFLSGGLEALRCFQST